MLLSYQIKNILNTALSNDTFSYVQFNQVLDDFYDCSTPDDQELLCVKLGITPKTLETYRVNLSPKQGRRIIKYILYLYLKSHIKTNGKTR